MGMSADPIGGEQHRARDRLELRVDGARVGHTAEDRRPQQRRGMAHHAARQHEPERAIQLASPLGADACVVADAAADQLDDLAGDRVARLRLVEHRVGEAARGPAREDLRSS